MENYFIKYYISVYLLEEIWHVNMKFNGISNREINKLLNEDISEENIDYFLKEFESMFYSMFISEKNVSFFNCGNFDDITFKSVANLFYLKIFLNCKLTTNILLKYKNNYRVLCKIMNFINKNEYSLNIMSGKYNHLTKNLSSELSTVVQTIYNMLNRSGDPNYLKLDEIPQFILLFKKVIPINLRFADILLKYIDPDMSCEYFEKILNIVKSEFDGTPLKYLRENLSMIKNSTLSIEYINEVMPQIYFNISYRSVFLNNRYTLETFILLVKYLGKLTDLSKIINQNKNLEKSEKEKILLYCDFSF